MTDTDDAEINRFLDQLELERAVLFAAAHWRAGGQTAEARAELIAKIDALTAFDAANPERAVSPPADARAGPDPAADLPAPAGPADDVRQAYRHAELVAAERAAETTDPREAAVAAAIANKIHALYDPEEDHG